MTQMPNPPAGGAGSPPGGAGMRPHRGAMILVFGILGIVLCVIFGIVAWVMGNGDLREMQAGRMDPSGEGLTKAGKICGIISVIWFLAIVVLYVILAVIGIGAAAASGSGGP